MQGLYKKIIEDAEEKPFPCNANSLWVWSYLLPFPHSFSVWCPTILFSLYPTFNFHIFVQFFSSLNSIQLSLSAQSSNEKYKYFNKMKTTIKINMTFACTSCFHLDSILNVSISAIFLCYL